MRAVAVELNLRRADVLRERFPGVTVVQADAVSVPLPGRPFRVAANPPYGISSSLLRTLLAPGSRLVAADIVLQRAVVRKHASRCRAKVQPDCRAHAAAQRVPAAAAYGLCGARRPPPEMSAVGMPPLTLNVRSVPAIHIPQ